MAACGCASQTRRRSEEKENFALVPARRQLLIAEPAAEAQPQVRVEPKPEPKFAKHEPSHVKPMTGLIMLGRPWEAFGSQNWIDDFFKRWRPCCI